MTRQKATILCVCDDLPLLVTRCAVLEREGYAVHPVMIQDFPPLPLDRVFDVAILCSTLKQVERDKVRASMARGTSVLDLHGFVHPIDLVQSVARCCTEREAATR